MTDLLSVLYVHFPAWRKAPYFSTISALSRHTLSVAFGLPLLSLSLFYQLISKLVFPFLIVVMNIGPADLLA